MGSSPAGQVRAPGTGCKTSNRSQRGEFLGVTLLGGTNVDERELDRLTFEAGHHYDFRLAALVRQLREHRATLRRYVTAHAAAAQAGTRLPAASQALLEAYNDARALLGEPSSQSGATVSRLAANDAASPVTSRSRS